MLACSFLSKDSSVVINLTRLGAGAGAYLDSPRFRFARTMGIGILSWRPVPCASHTGSRGSEWLERTQLLLTELCSSSMVPSRCSVLPCKPPEK